MDLEKKIIYCCSLIAVSLAALLSYPWHCEDIDSLIRNVGSNVLSSLIFVIIAALSFDRWRALDEKRRNQAINQSSSTLIRRRMSLYLSRVLRAIKLMDEQDVSTLESDLGYCDKVVDKFERALQDGEFSTCFLQSFNSETISIFLQRVFPFEGYFESISPHPRPEIESILQSFFGYIESLHNYVIQGPVKTRDLKDTEKRVRDGEEKWFQIIKLYRWAQKNELSV